jgi:hypothetical protein
MKSEMQIACELVKVLDGVPIDLAKRSLASAEFLLNTTQVVSAKSPLLDDEIAKAEKIAEPPIEQIHQTGHERRP